RVGTAQLEIAETVVQAAGLDPGRGDLFRSHQVQLDQRRQDLVRELAALPVVGQQRPHPSVQHPAQPAEHQTFGRGEQLGEPVPVTWVVDRTGGRADALGGRGGCGRNGHEAPSWSGDGTSCRDDASAQPRPRTRTALSLRIFGRTWSLRSSFSKSASHRSGVISGKSEPNSTLSCSSELACRTSCGGKYLGDQPDRSMYTLALWVATAIASSCQGTDGCAMMIVNSGKSAATASSRMGLE